MNYRARFECLNGFAIEQPLDDEDVWIRDYIRKGAWSVPFEIDSLPQGLLSRVVNDAPLLSQYLETNPVIKVTVTENESQPKAIACSGDRC